ncbi:AAC(3)-I family aminoglycoside N-acetyltransferase [[Limnothrix rosea] IAM M-220]|uniref:AAC(3)-I family aminoglycoside N-acetyltransferase n=1 Tax=[Limnothrix rosea] IAM M-220 TaxID=454133 RepID=UPI00095BE84D|nr:AAC(3)-I family aminoglycoside N-acetyltransferase [[Limnothrix rosea] IAM M-220]OKH17093.1 AAC(3)-I family aminoglycoside 3-N-acetyltransferase [[Limnothrix rosea] IAM M-220]
MSFTNPPAEIRQLVTTDLHLMRQLLDVFGDAFQDKKSYCNHQPTDEYLQNLLNCDYFITLVALKSEQVVGGLVAYEFQKFEQARSEVYIYDLAVLEEYQRQGIATACIEKVREIAAVRGAYVVIIHAEKDNDPAINLYSKLGIREDVLHFDIPIPKQSPD